MIASFRSSYATEISSDWRTTKTNQDCSRKSIPLAVINTCWSLPIGSKNVPSQYLWKVSLSPKWPRHLHTNSWLIMILLKNYIPKTEIVFLQSSFRKFAAYWTFTNRLQRFTIIEEWTGREIQSRSQCGHPQLSWQAPKRLGFIYAILNIHNYLPQSTAQQLLNLYFHNHHHLWR